MRPRHQPLDVYLGGQLIGELTRPGSGRIAFQYSADAATEYDGAPLLSASLPAQEARFTNSQTKPFFEGLLPEDAIRRRVAAEFHVSYGNAFGLLEKIGAECAGAVVVVPTGETPPSPDQAEVDWLTEDELAQRVQAVREYPLGIEPGRVRLSLGGVQDKLVLVRSPSGQFAVPLNGAPSTHIVKPNQERYTDIVANEAYCLRIAACSGMAVARSEVIQVGGVDCLVVERFDRTIGQGVRVERLHQEDLCQALGVLPEAKYEAEGGPSASDVVDAIRLLSVRPAADLIAFLRALIFNFVVGNSDAHAKNFAFLYEPLTQARLAPLYDLVCTAIYDVEQSLAMSIGGARDPDDISAESWNQLAQDLRSSQRAVSEEVVETSARVLECARAAQGQAVAEGWHRPVVDEILDVIEHRATPLLGAT